MEQSPLDEIEVALISITDGVNPADAVQKAFDVINRERQKLIAAAVAVEQREASSYEE